MFIILVLSLIDIAIMYASMVAYNEKHLEPKSQKTISKNSDYRKCILQHCNSNHKLTFKNFIDICTKLNLLIFEIKRVINSFDEPHNKVFTNTYANMTEYRDTMPSWSAKEYDYKNDRATFWIKIAEITAENFCLHADNSSSTYEWDFEVLEDCVLVHYTFTHID